MRCDDINIFWHLAFVERASQWSSQLGHLSFPLCCKSVIVACCIISFDYAAADSMGVEKFYLSSLSRMLTLIEDERGCEKKSNTRLSDVYNLQRCVATDSNDPLADFLLSVYFSLSARSENIKRHRDTLQVSVCEREHEPSRLLSSDWRCRVDSRGLRYKI